MTTEEALFRVRQGLDRLAYTRLVRPLEPALEDDYRRLCQQERELLGLAQPAA
jgi:hypothetical protein